MSPSKLFINNLLQGKWSGARDESYRFVCNSTVGVAGFFDVAGQWKLPKSDADFGQTFGQWGWKPGKAGLRANPNIRIIVIQNVERVHKTSRRGYAP